MHQQTVAEAKHRETESLHTRFATLGATAAPHQNRIIHYPAISYEPQTTKIEGALNASCPKVPNVFFELRDLRIQLAGRPVRYPTNSPYDQARSSKPVRGKAPRKARLFLRVRSTFPAWRRRSISGSNGQSAAKTARCTGDSVATLTAANERPQT